MQTHEVSELMQRDTIMKNISQWRRERAARLSSPEYRTAKEQRVQAQLVVVHQAASVPMTQVKIKHAVQVRGKFVQGGRP